METTKKVINYFDGAPVPKYLNKIPKDVELLTLEYCVKNERYYNIDNSFKLDYTFLNEYKKIKSLFLYNWGDFLPKNNLVYLLENKLLTLPKTLKFLSFYFYDSVFFKSLNFLTEYNNLEFLIINTVFTKENINYLPNNILYLEYKFKMEDVDNIIEALDEKLKNLKRIYLFNYQKTELSEPKYNELINKLQLKNIEIISEYDNFDIEEFIMELFEDENTEVKYINVTRECEEELDPDYIRVL